MHAGGWVCEEGASGNEGTGRTGGALREMGAARRLRGVKFGSLCKMSAREREERAAGAARLHDFPPLQRHKDHFHAGERTR